MVFFLKGNGVMKEIKIEQCPYCGGTDFIKGYGVQAISGSSKVANSWNLSNLVYTVCKDCGSIVHTQVEKLDRLISSQQELEFE